MSLFGWFRPYRPRRQPDPKIELSLASRWRLAQATQRHKQASKRLTRVALNDIELTQTDGSVAQSADVAIGTAIATATRRYHELHGPIPQDYLEEMVDFMAREL